MTKFEKAFKAMPRCVGGFDALTHFNVDDLVFLTQLQMDLFEEGEESDIKNRRQYEQCKKYVQTWSVSLDELTSWISDLNHVAK